MIMGFSRLSNFEQLLSDENQESPVLDDNLSNVYHLKKCEGNFTIPEGWKEKALNTEDNESLEAKFIKKSSQESNPTIILFSCTDLYEAFLKDSDFKNSGIARSDVGPDLFSMDDVLSMFSLTDLNVSNVGEEKIGTKTCYGFDLDFGESRRVEILIENGYLFMFELYDSEGENAAETNKKAMYEMIESFELSY